MEHSKKLDLSISAADLKRIEQILDYHFSRPERVALALTHSSWANEHGLGRRTTSVWSSWAMPSLNCAFRGSCSHAFRRPAKAK